MEYLSEEHDKLYRRPAVRNHKKNPRAKIPSPEQKLQALSYVEWMKDRGAEMEAIRVGTSAHELVEKVADDAPADPGQLDELGGIITAAMKALVKLGAWPEGPALLYLGTDQKAYRVDDPNCQFNESREASLAEGLIIEARSIVQRNLDRLRYRRSPSLALQSHDQVKLEASRGREMAEGIKTRADDGVDKHWARVEEGEIRVGYYMDGGERFSYTDAAGQRRVTTEFYRPMPGQVFARVLDGPKDTRGHVFEGWCEGKRFNFKRDGSIAPSSTSKFEVLQERMYF